MMPDGQPDKTWNNKDILLKIVGELGELKGELGGIKTGFKNHLTQHFRINMALLGGVIALSVTGFYFFLRLVL